MQRKKLTISLVLLVLMLGLLGVAGTVCADDLGSMSPQKALEYMKTNDDLIIVDTALPEYYEKQHFEGAINIPAKEMAEHYSDFPEGAKVMLHCRIGKTCLPAYNVLQEKRPDLELSYIGGTPLFEAYNGWMLKYKKIDK